MVRAMLVALICGTLVSVSSPGASAAPAPLQAQESGFKDADALLTALETADASLTALSAEIRYDRTFAIQGDRQVRTGSLYFLSESGPEQVVPPLVSRKFAIRFQRLAVGERVEKETKDYVFDGTWLVERLPQQKKLTKRQIVPDGQRFDPLRIGEGPMPIPIGQKREEILGRYDAELVPAIDALPGPENKELRAFVQGAYQLRLTPRPELIESDEFREIRLWYRRDKDGVLLPRMAKTLSRSGDESVVQLINVKINSTRSWPGDLFDTATPERGWDVTVQPWREPEVPGVDVPGLETSIKVLPPEEEPPQAPAPAKPDAPSSGGGGL